MPSLRSCLAPGCTNLIRGASRCPDHQLKSWARAKPRPDLQTREWRALSKRRRLAFPMCEVCGVRRSTAVDHIVRPADGGTNAWANLRSICSVCHGTKTAHEGHAGRWKKGKR